MTVFDLEKDEQGDWFTFFDSTVDLQTGETRYHDVKEGAAEFRIRSLGEFYTSLEKERKKVHKFVLNPSTRDMERVSFHPDLTAEVIQAEEDDGWDWAITDFKGVKGSGGIDIECTRKNKLKLVKIPRVNRFLMRVFQVMAQADGGPEKN